MEAQHRFHAAVAVRREIHASHQLTAAGRRILDGRREALTIFAKGAGLARRHDPRLQFRPSAGALRIHNERTIFKPAQQRPVGRRAQRPGPVVLLRAAGTRLRGQPLNHFVEGVKREVDDGGRVDFHILALRGQERRSHGLQNVSPRCQRRDQKTAFAVGVRAGDDAQVGAQQFHFSADLRHACGIPHHSRHRSCRRPAERSGTQSHQHGETGEIGAALHLQISISAASLAIFLESVATQVPEFSCPVEPCAGLFLFDDKRCRLRNLLFRNCVIYFHSHLIPTRAQTGNWQGFFHCQLIAMRP